jgi:hypothetical protein
MLTTHSLSTLHSFTAAIQATFAEHRNKTTDEIQLPDDVKANMMCDRRAMRRQIEKLSSEGKLAFQSGEYAEKVKWDRGLRKTRRREWRNSHPKESKILSTK